MQEIDLIDLAKVLISKWLILVIAIVIGVACGGAYGVYRNSNTNKSIQATNAANAKVNEQESLELPDCDGTYDSYVARLNALATCVGITENEQIAVQEALLMYSSMESIETAIANANSQMNSSKKASDINAAAETLGLLAESYSEMQSLLTTSVGKMTDTQKSLFNEVVDKKVLEAPSLDLVGNDGEIKEIPQVAVTSGLPKMCVIGAFALFVVAAGCYAAVYVLTPTIKTRQEFENRYDCFCMGVLSADSKNKKYESAMDLTVTNITATCKENDMSDIMVCTTVKETELSAETLDTLKSRLKDEQVNVSLIDELLVNDSGLKDVLNSKRVIIIEKLNKSNVASVDDMAKIFEKHQIEVLGAILL